MSTTLILPDKKADKIVAGKYVKGQSSDISCRQPSVDSKEVYCEKAEEFYEKLKRAIHEVNEDIAGRKQLRTLEEFLDDYQSRTDC